MNKPYRIKVFGKPGCDKCKLLQERLDSVLKAPEWADFDKEYCDLQTVEGLVEFSEAECINPQRVPAFLVTRWHEPPGRYEPVTNAQPGRPDEVCRKSRLHQLLGLQTDYGDVGRGVITPRMITAILAEARA